MTYRVHRVSHVNVQPSARVVKTEVSVDEEPGA